MTFSEELSGVLADAYTLISKVEESMVGTSKNFNVTINEVHMLEVVGRGGDKGRTISEIAMELSITLASVTVAVKKLAQKGYVEKSRCDKDGRVVYVRLTEEGKRIDRIHRRFHRNMAYSIAQGFNDAEKEVLLGGILKMNRFLKHNVEKMEAAK
jgi:DNA-binding MarR family transcriptional regulator